MLEFMGQMGSRYIFRDPGTHLMYGLSDDDLVEFDVDPDVLGIGVWVNLEMGEDDGE